MLTSTGTTRHTILHTRLGDLTLVRDGDSLTGLYFPHHWHRPDPATFGPREDAGFDDVAVQLTEYLEGARRSFSLRLAPSGSDLDLAVWAMIGQIPYGQTTSYGDIARLLGGVSAQEVGAATGRNPLCICVPCHRVVGSTGKLTGYAGGLARKRTLLDLEQRPLR
jgi:methylated-DNA-[protein]-cysteine S-methyltransferase